MSEELLNAINTLNITMCRVYDAQMAMLSVMNPEVQQQVENAHEEGRFLGAPPIITDNPFDIDEQPPVQ